MKPLFQYTALLLLTLSTLVSAAPSEDTSPPEGTPVTMVKAIQITMISATMIRGEIESPNTPHIAAKVSAEVVSIKLRLPMTTVLLKRGLKWWMKL